MKRYLIFLIAFLILFLFVFRDLYSNITTNLVDWADYPFYIWVTDQNITKIVTFDFRNFFDTNIYYPHKYTLLFSDITLPQTILTLLPFIMTKNLILSFNFMILLNFILNFTASYLFWKQIFKKSLTAFYGSLFFIFSPFFFLELGHLPDLSYWPFFLTLYLLFKYEEGEQSLIPRRLEMKKIHWKTFIFIGLGLSIQFLASVYLSVFLIFAILIFYLLKIATQSSKKLILSQFFVIFLVFFLTSGIFINGYINMKNLYRAERSIREYIYNSANLTDYIFTTSIKSVIHKSFLMDTWNKQNNTRNSLFPGFLISVLTAFALFKLRKISRKRTYFLILIITGFLFSLGPRLVMNGNFFVNITLPYSVLFKYLPLIDVIRVIIRWSFLFFFGMTYFSAVSFNYLISKQAFPLGSKPLHKITLLVIFIIFILEYIPLNLKSARKTYITYNYQLLKNICTADKKVLIELPLTHLELESNIPERLEYITNILLSSTYHRCLLVNGYSGYDLPENFTLSAALSKQIADSDIESFSAEMRKRNIDIVKINQSFFIEKPQIAKFVNNLSNDPGIQKINDDLFMIKK